MAFASPFGMMMPGREYQAQPSRFGFNGKENDNDVKGFGNEMDFGARVYDPRIGKFLSKDHMARSFSGDGPYNFAGNSPIAFVDFNGYFKISPFFVQRYPTLARLLQYYMPLLKDNPQIKSAWIRTIGFSNYAEGEKAFDEMVTYGKGPWITPTRKDNELRIAGLARFAEPTSEGSFSEYNYPDNLAISYYRLDDLETALKGGNALDVGQAMFIVSSLIMHEASHWGKWKYNCCEKEDSRFHMGSVFEFEAFGQKFTNKFGYKSPFDDKLAKSYYDKERGRYGSPTFGMSINILDGKYNYWKKIKDGPLDSGQVGDQTVIDNGDKEELPKVFQPKERSKNNGKFTYND